jgi:hypothetical protein
MIVDTRINLSFKTNAQDPPPPIKTINTRQTTNKRTNKQTNKQSVRSDPVGDVDFFNDRLSDRRCFFLFVSSLRATRTDTLWW